MMKVFDKRKVPGLEDFSSDNEDEDDMPSKKHCYMEDIEIELEVQENEFLKEEPTNCCIEKLKKINNVWGDVVHENILDESFNKVGVNQMTVQRNVESYCVDIKERNVLKRRRSVRKSNGHIKSEPTHRDRTKSPQSKTGYRKANSRSKKRNESRSSSQNTSKSRSKDRNESRSYNNIRVTSQSRSKERNESRSYNNSRVTSQSRFKDRIQSRSYNNLSVKSESRLKESTECRSSNNRGLKSESRVKDRIDIRSFNRGNSPSESRNKDRVESRSHSTRHLKSKSRLKDRVGSRSPNGSHIIPVSKFKNIKDRLNSRSSNKVKSRRYIPIDPVIDTPQKIVFEIARLLQEPKIELIEKCYKVLGRDKCLEFYYMTEDIEENGGLSVIDGSRRRTAGGVFLTLIKQSKNVDNRSKRLIFQYDFDNARIARPLPMNRRAALNATNGWDLGCQKLVIPMSTESNACNHVVKEDAPLKVEEVLVEEELEEGEIT